MRLLRKGAPKFFVTFTRGAFTSPGGRVTKKFFAELFFKKATAFLELK